MSVKSAVNLLRGSVALEVTGEFPERFLNLCAQRGVTFWGVERPDEHTLRLTVAWPDRKGLEELAAKAGCVVVERGRRGAPPFLLRFRKRYAFLIGLALAMVAVCFLSRFVLVVEVEGNETVSNQVILTELGRLGVKPGVYGPSLRVRDVCNQALLRLDGLSWMTINLHGIRAQVVVREKTPKPELIDETVHGDIVAEASGIVTRVEAWAGDAAVAVGDTVLPGDVLIRGSVRLDPPQYSELSPEWVPVRAQGKVEGRTWRTLSASIPLTAEVKAPTGGEQTAWSLTIFGQRVNFRQNSGIPYERYDKITETWPLTLPGSQVPLLALRRETWRAYDVETVEIDAAAAQAMLEERLSAKLKELLGETGEEVDHTFDVSEENGMLVVTLTAECREELGRFVPTASPSTEGESGQEDPD